MKWTNYLMMQISALTLTTILCCSILHHKVCAYFTLLISYVAEFCII